MRPATEPRDRTLDGRLLCVEPWRGRFEDQRMRDLPRWLRAGDLLVMNDAATLPASLQAKTTRGEAIEVRLAGRGDHEGEWRAVLFGAGDWRMRTEDRPVPPPLHAGDTLLIQADFAASVRRTYPASPRLVDLSFNREGEAFWEALYRHGKPIQYSYLRAPLSLRNVQTVYAARPWAVEPPSAGGPLNWELLTALRHEGIRFATITHEAGLSSTGDPSVDALLPLPEHFEVPESTVQAVQETRHHAGRVVAVGTTTVRALEAAAVQNHGRLVPTAGATTLRIQGGAPLRVVDGVLTGIHEPGTSHFSLLEALAPQRVLMAAHQHAESVGYRGHEFGDSMLILRREAA